MYRRVWSEINLDNLKHNLRVLQSQANNVGIWAVVKADAYGHGAIEVSKAIQKSKIRGLCVASLEEAIELRENGIKIEILVLGETIPEGVPLLQRYKITQCLFRPEHLEGWERQLDPNLPAPNIHVKIDTGMHRLGVPPAALKQLAKEFKETPFEPTGIFSHFHVADTDSRSTLEALEKFRKSLKESDWMEKFPDCERHIANSPAFLRGPEYYMDSVRIGYLLYGSKPTGTDLKNAPPVLPVMSVHARVIDRKTIEKNEGFGYGNITKFNNPTRLAIVPIGYADGYTRSLSGHSEVLIRGRRAPVVGAISMDFLYADISNIPDVEIGDRVTMLGKQGHEEITMMNLAEWGKTIPYEMLCSFGKRPPRQFKNTESKLAI
ncbi:alanine racemase [bacterium]|nr:alanine racemase [bacterium]|tara:strand:- start:12741 stop:13874 length:1134 start_codon:yes stop_codon:yes gene_type:complete